MKKVTQLLLSSALVLGMLPFAGSATAATTSFKDVPASHWAKASIDAAVSKGYFKGYSDGTFKPGATVTRAEFAALLSRVSKGTPELEQANVFRDLTGHWSEGEVNRAVSLGFLKVSDYPNGFKPSTALTREEMAKWLSSGLAAQNEDFKQALKDTDTANTLVPVAEFYKGGLKKAAYPYVSVVLGTGLMAGYPDGTFGPGKTTTRAEAAVILSRYQQVQESKADSYRDLNEMREVGLTGTNLTSATPYVYGKMYGTDIVASFDKITEKPFKLRNNLGTMTIHRMIVADALSKTNVKNLYGKMFIDKDYSTQVIDEYYEVFVEATVTPNGDNLSTLAFLNATGNHLTSGFSFSSGAVEKYSISNLPRKEFVKDGVFQKGITKRFWMITKMNRNLGGPSSGRGGIITVGKDVTSFHLPSK
ncbi:S-layer homology domain-containing protein [Paenibacillus polysaccharolyticus]|uniref:S-layer homology domain-containing protein n=1 Tax=Paenibacillus polysaccharolyticus TaxID=582692 RepID=UPI00280B0857|nr:S-layer homology domain-containing protein [Paenibacillus polysaccharolyticus]